MSTANVVKEEGQPKEEADATQPPPKGWRFWLVFLAMCLCTMVAALDMGSMATALPAIVHDLGGSQSFAWVSSAYSLATTAIIPFSGRLAEIFGRRHILLLSLLIFAAGSLICSLAHSMVVLIVGRAIQGIGSGIIQNLTTIVVADIVSLRERGFYSSLTGMAFTIATGVGPFLGGGIVQKTTWRWLFYINLPMCGLAFLVVYLFLHVKRPAKLPFKNYLQAMDLLGNSLIILATTSCIIALTWGGVSFPWTSAHVLAPLIIGILGLIGALWYEISFASHPSIPLNILSNRTSVSGYFGSFIHGLVITCVTFYLPIYFQAGKAVDPLLSGLSIFPTVIMISPSAILQGLLISKFGHYRRMNFLGWAMMLLGIGLFTMLTRDSSIGVTVPFQIIASLGFGFLFATTFSVLAPLDVTLNAPALSFLTFIRTFPKPWAVTLGATILQNILKRRLPSTFTDQFTSINDLTYVAIPTITSLEEPLRTEVQDAYVHALHVLWLTMLGLCVLGFISVFMQKEITLHTRGDSKWGLKGRPPAIREQSSDQEKSSEIQEEVL